MVKRTNVKTFKHELNQRDDDDALMGLKATNLLGMIVLFQHGFNGNAVDWRSSFYQIDRHSKYLDAYVFKDDYLMANAKISSNLIYNSLKENRLLLKNKVTFIRTQFKNGWSGLIDDQAGELVAIINNIKEILGPDASSFRFALVGHSKGGLVNLRLTQLYPDITNNLVSVNTPYFGLKSAGVIELWNLFARQIKSPGIKEQIEMLHKNWEDQIKRPLVSAIGINNQTGSDGLVATTSALGNGSVTSFMEKKNPYEGFFNRIELVGSGIYYRHLGSLGNIIVTYNIIDQLIKQVSSNYDS